MQKRIQKRLMDAGVTILDGDNTYIDENVKIGQDSVIYPFSLIYKDTVIGPNCRVGPAAHLIGAKLGSNVYVHNSYITDSVLEDDVVVGPFAHIRGKTVLSHGSHVGNFVEITRSRIGANSGANHLSFIGDTTMGKDVNLGAGIITANWDAKKRKKSRSVIGDGVSIGSNTVIISPARVKKGVIVPNHSSVSGSIVKSKK
jgi:bifunctional UDP-N-acetylglucosamine pyrophosphorylase/glucosamine-1-phosphate N-acetyltransferase